MLSHPPLSQLLDRNSVDMVVHRFYQHVRDEPRLSGYFIHIDNWPEHEAHIGDFWWGIMGGKVAHPRPYAMERGHLNLAFGPRELELWLALFAQAMYESLPGEIASRWDDLAQQLGRKMNERVLGQTAPH